MAWTKREKVWGQNTYMIPSEEIHWEDCDAIRELMYDIGVLQVTRKIPQEIQEMESF